MRVIVLKRKQIYFSRTQPKFSLCKNKTISSNFCRSSSIDWNRVYIKYKNYNHDSDASAGFGLFIMLMKIIPQFSRIFPGKQENCLFLKEFSRALEEIFKILGVFQEFQEKWAPCMVLAGTICLWIYFDIIWAGSI